MHEILINCLYLRLLLRKMIVLRMVTVLWFVAVGWLHLAAILSPSFVTAVTVFLIMRAIFVWNPDHTAMDSVIGILPLSLSFLHHHLAKSQNDHWWKIKLVILGKGMNQRLGYQNLERQSLMWIAFCFFCLLIDSTTQTKSSWSDLDDNNYDHFSISISLLYIITIDRS